MAAPLIAVIDNEEVFLDMMRDVLVDAGYRAVTAARVSEVTALIARVRPDLLILDLRMDAVDSGWQLLHTLRAAPATARLPIILCSADARFLRDHAGDCVALRCDVLPKPFALDDLLARVARHVGA